MTRPHLSCWDSKEEVYQHVCQEPSGKTCYGLLETGPCTNQAGTWWTPLWCPDCDVVRQNLISAQLRALINPTRKET